VTPKTSFFFLVSDHCGDQLLPSRDKETKTSAGKNNVLKRTRYLIEMVGNKNN
jgi:hypothetical protein